MRRAMQEALSDARVRGDDVDYVNGHGTGTDVGDIAEANATRAAFARAVPFSATKSSTGHTLGACGAIEAVFCVQMMRRGFLAPNRNLDDVDPRCASLGWIRQVVRTQPRLVMSNNFAFGGVNTSLIFARMED
jgi:3-oxoacyl-[acyl-carrier-protein] synthase II